MMSERSRLQGVRGFAQLSVVVKSIDETVAFYTDLLGFEADGDWEGDTAGLKAMIGIDGITGRSVVGNIGHLRIEFMDYSIFGKGAVAPPGSLGINNLTFEVDDIDSIHRQCVAMALQPGHEPAAISSSTTTAARDFARAICGDRGRAGNAPERREGTCRDGPLLFRRGLRLGAVDF